MTPSSPSPARDREHPAAFGHIVATGFALTVMICAALGVHAALVQREQAQSWHATLEHTDVLVAAQELGYRFEQKVATWRALYITRDERLRAEVADERALFLAMLGRLGAFAIDDDSRALLERIARTEREHEHLWQQGTSTTNAAAWSERLTHEVKPLRDAIDADLTDLVEAQRDQIAVERMEAEAIAARSTAVVTIASLIGVAIGSVLAWASTMLARRAQAMASRSRELEARARMFAILEAVPAGVFVLAKDGTPHYANARATELLGRSVDPRVGVEALTERYDAYVAGTQDVYPSERAPIVRALRGESAVVTDMEIERAGRRTALQVQAQPVYGPGGQIEFAVAAFVDVAELRRQASEDPLTGLANRAAFLDGFARVRSVCSRGDQPIAIAIVDIDHFKAVNDCHGHGTGDDVLRRVAELIARRVRGSDLVARWGGEEFALLMPVTEVDGAVRLLEQLLVLVRAEEFTGPDGRPFSVTFSAGVVAVGPEDDVTHAIARADVRLYAAKAAGRARVFGLAERDAA